MKDYVIIADSTSDLGKDLREQYNIQYVKMNIVVDGQEKVASLDWDIYSPKELYDWMRGGLRVYTNQVPQEEFDKEFRKYLNEGKDILYIACSSALSASVQTGKSVALELQKEFKDSKIIVIDSLTSCLGQAQICVKASELRSEGKSIDEVASWVEENKLCFHQYATVESLSYLKNAGRVKASAAFFGNIFGVKPIIISDAKGQNYALKKVKGRRTSMIEMVNMMKAECPNLEDQIIYIGHADCEVDMEFLKDLIIRELKPRGVYVNYIGPIIGASTGPGTLGIYAFGNKVEVVGE